MDLSDLQITGTGRRPGVRQLRRMLGRGKTYDERGRTYMKFDDDFSDEGEFERVYNILQKEFGEPEELQYGGNLGPAGFKFGPFTLKKMNYGSELSFSYM